MKRQGSSTGGQPPVKKPDASTDLRSKIGAKLQTLLNGIDKDSLLYAKRRKQLYEDLFGKPKYSEIIIDPTIVIKEEPDVEESNSASSNFLNSQNFLLSAKSRLTELLNKQQDGANKYKDSGKENTLISNRNKLSVKSNSLQNPSCSKSPSRLYNSPNKNRNFANKGPSSDSRNNDDHSKKLVVVLEDCMKSDSRTKSSPTKRPVRNLNSSNLKPNHINKQDGLLTSLNNVVNKKDNIVGSKSSCSGSMSSNDPSPSKVMEHAGLFPSTEEYASPIPYYNEDESEMADDPIIPQVIVDIKVGESLTTDGNGNFEIENSDPEVELLCVKQPIAEVITLEDNENEVVEDTELLGRRKEAVQVGGFLHKCKQCGKSFRAESLLNFHIRMHGKNSSQSSSSSSHSFS